MVEGYWAERRGGDPVWRDDAPETCGQGHPGPLRPGWSSCPTCGRMGRQWVCPNDDCGDVQVDHDHPAIDPGPTSGGRPGTP